MTELNNISILEFKNYLLTLSLDELRKLKTRFDDQYYNSEKGSELDDAHYDILQEVISEKTGTYTVGAPIRDIDNRVTLPYWLGSADKLKPEDEGKIERWITKNKSSRYVLSDKLDGVSCLLVVKNGVMHLYSRGDGKVGGLITYLANQLIKTKNIPRNLPDIAVRGELIVSKKNFEKCVGYTNSRNMMSGLVNSKEEKPEMKYVEFITYEIVSTVDTPISNQLEKLRELGFKVVEYKVVKEISVLILSEYLLERRQNSKYDIDGIIVQSNNPYTRNVDGNPSYMFAFKMLITEDIATTVIEGIKWNTSRNHILTPVAMIKPVVIDNSTINNVTLYNARYVKDNKLGKGSIVQITKSGGIIPKIIKVITATGPEFPTVPYIWDTNRVEILTELKTDAAKINEIHFFFKTLDIKDLGPKRVELLFKQGFTSVVQIITASRKTLGEALNSEKVGATIYNNIQEGLHKYSEKTPENIAILLHASSSFEIGIGSRNLENLLNHIPDIFALYQIQSRKIIIDSIVKIKGFSDILATKVYNGLGKAIEFLDTFYKIVKASSSSSSSSSRKEEKEVISTKPLFPKRSLQNQVVVMTGFTSKSLDKLITELGGRVSSTFVNATTILLVKDKDSTSSKMQKAQEKGIPIMTEQEFFSYINSTPEKIQFIKSELLNKNIDELKKIAKIESSDKNKIVKYILENKNIMNYLISCI